jgi:hypothetical protein
MQVFAQTFVSHWRNYWRKDNLALWFAIVSILLGAQFFLIWLGIHRALLYIAIYYKPSRPFLIQRFGFPPTILEIPIPKFSFLVLVSILIRVFVVSFYIGAGIWLTTQVGFKLSIFYILYLVFK